MIMIDGEEEFELSQILQHRPLKKQRGDSNLKYLVKWIWSCLQQLGT